MNAHREPIHIDPLLGEVFELLHRMTKSSDEVLAWHAWGAIRTLEKYEDKVRAEMRREDRV